MVVATQKEIEAIAEAVWSKKFGEVAGTSGSSAADLLAKDVVKDVAQSHALAALNTRVSEMSRKIDLIVSTLG